MAPPEAAIWRAGVCANAIPGIRAVSIMFRLLLKKQKPSPHPASVTMNILVMLVILHIFPD
ncbi:MAG: hypothetical protein H7835_21030, partial [Magnetococcus sp. XQGC-1]